MKHDNFSNSCHHAINATAMCSSHFPLAKPVFCFSSFLHLNCRALELVLFLILSTLKTFPD
uniref:Uncharacterized protein n=1 Tax=Daphnia magna TaxID=35525 RepID=A0A0P5CRM0_9CRUS